MKGRVPGSMALYANLAISISHVVGTGKITAVKEVNRYRPYLAAGLAAH